MAITVVQNKAGSTTEPTTVTFTSLPTAGNAVIVIFNDNGDHSISTVADNQTGAPNTYTAVVNKQDSTGTNTFAGVYWCPSVTVNAGTFAVTCTPSSASGNKMGVVILEVSGLAGTVDQTGSANDGGTNPTSLTITASAQNTSANDLAVYSVVLKGAGGNAAFYSAGATTGWTSPSVLNANSNGIGSAAGYKILNALETTQAVSQTVTTGTPCAGVVATFTGAGSGVSKNLTAQTATSSEGTVAPEADYFPTAQTVTSTEGTIPPEVDYFPTGQTATFSEGTITPTQPDVTLGLSALSAVFAEGQITITGEDTGVSQAGGSGKRYRRPKLASEIFQEEMAKLTRQATEATEQRVSIEAKIEESKYAPVPADIARYIADFERALKRAEAIERRQSEAVEVPVYFRVPAKSEGAKKVDAFHHLKSLAKIARHREQVAQERLRKVRDRIDEEAATYFMNFIMWDD